MALFTVNMFELGCGWLNAAEKAPRHVTKPISTVTVKVVSAADFTRGKLHLEEPTKEERIRFRLTSRLL